MSDSSLALSHSWCFNIADKMFNGKTMRLFFFFSHIRLGSIRVGVSIRSALQLQILALLFELCCSSWLALESCQPVLSLHTLCSAELPLQLPPQPLPHPTPRGRSLVGLIGSVPRGKEISWQSVKEKLMSEEIVWIFGKSGRKKKKLSKSHTISVLIRE